MVARAVGIACLLSLGACATETLHHRAETFAADSPFQRNFNASPVRACDAARMVLLGQGYVLAANVPDNPPALVGSKEFKDRDERFSVLQVHVTCRAVQSGATVFASALETRYGVLKREDTSTVGAPLLSPIRITSSSANETQAKIAGETVQDRAFYERFFAALALVLRNKEP
ncbi:MAG: DUF2242 domain-containing protein [Rhodocyclaceae bacterium]|nr:DUF2242 domain-containing protein [Rhodocyclaceae bacterium]